MYVCVCVYVLLIEIIGIDTMLGKEKRKHFTYLQQ